MPFVYKTGEEILRGDRVMFHGEPGQIEFVVDRVTGEPALDWYMEEFGGGVMVLEPNRFGRAFLHETQDQEDLLFVARA
jgi:hypothetical protein